MSLIFVPVLSESIVQDFKRKSADEWLIFLPKVKDSPWSLEAIALLILSAEIWKL